MKTKRSKIIVIESDRTLHSAYTNYFDKFFEFSLEGIYCNTDDALKEFKKTKPDIIVTEVDLVALNGIDSIPYYKRKDWNVKVIMISRTNDFEVIKKAFKYGANGYLTKPIDADKLYYALNSIKKEGAVMSNDIVKKVIANFRRKSFKLFSERENQIVDYLCKGATYKMIADKLFVTTSTVNFHIQNIYLKLDVNSKSEALSKIEQL
ncbi:DNA-binding response regulator [Maribacter sp. 4U21]|uniref:response regulator transcription factor n=1 Tax=Maribacter sp. 4U21 TaxID=1889779 RepID=UPI000C14F362|nr:response regulator transcription factor [Maribacter sp. 4U21]PIB25748.1 DNA-binding response regulator [Maribacter sp. 4U21]